MYVCESVSLALVLTLILTLKQNKMGQFESGKWIIFLSVYFIGLIFALSLVQYTAGIIGVDYSITTTGNMDTLQSFSNTQDGFFCSQPRTFLNPNTGEYDEIGYFSQYSASCIWTDGNYDQNRCNDIPGCTWQPTSTVLWFFTVDAFCDGTVNLTQLSNYDTQTTSLGKSKTSLHEEGVIYIIDNTESVQYLNQYGTVSNNICGIPNSRDGCVALGCSWVQLSQSDESGDASLGTILDITGSLFTFKASFTDEYWTDTLLTLILFYIPLLMYIIAIYFALPFLH